MVVSPVVLSVLASFGVAPNAAQHQRIAALDGLMGRRAAPAAAVIQPDDDIGFLLDTARLLLHNTHYYAPGKMTDDMAGFSHADEPWAERFLAEGAPSTSALYEATVRLSKYKRQLGNSVFRRIMTIRQRLEQTGARRSRGGTVSWDPTKPKVFRIAGLYGPALLNAGLSKNDMRAFKNDQTGQWAHEFRVASYETVARVLDAIGKKDLAAEVLAEGPAWLFYAEEEAAKPAEQRPVVPDRRVKLIDQHTIRVPTIWLDDGRPKDQQPFMMLRAHGAAVSAEFKADWMGGKGYMDLVIDEMPIWMPILLQDAPSVAAAVQALVQTAPQEAPPTAEEIANAKMVWRRMSHMLAPEAKGTDPDFSKIALMLRRVHPGQTSVDLGPLGAFKLENVGRKPDGTKWDPAEAILAVRAPAGKWYERQQATYVRGLRKPLPPDWHARAPLKQAPAFARALDLHAPALAMALRIGLLTDAQARTCAELDVLSVARELSEIPDPSLRARCERMIHGLRFPPGIKLKPYQEVGVCFGYFANYRCLLGDSAGLGKSPQAISLLKLDPARTLPALIVAPAGVVRNWTRKELPKFAPEFGAQIIETARPIEDLRRYPIAVIGYATLDRNLERLVKAGFKSLILDESQNIKNAAAGWSKAALNLASSMQNAVLLSGTPMENKDPSELWTQLHIIDPLTFPSRKEFADRFGMKGKRKVKINLAKAEEAEDLARLGEGQGFEFIDRNDLSEQEKLAELRDGLRCYMVRRLYSEVAKDMPPKMRLPPIYEPLPKQTKAAYQQVEKDFEDYLCANFKIKATDFAARRFLQTFPTLRSAGLTEREARDTALKDAVAEANQLKPDYGAAEVLAKMGALRSAVGVAKLPLMVEWIRSWFADNPNEPVIFFVDNKPVVTGLVEQLQPGGALAGITYAVINGETPLPRRANIVDDFQDGKIQLLIGTLAMHTGLTLTRSSNVTFGQRFWTPSKEEQAEGRAYRTGQTKTTFIRYIMAADTIDERLAEIVDEKREIIGRIMRVDEAQSGAKESIAGGDEMATASAVADAMFERLRQGAGGGCAITTAEVWQRVQVMTAS